MRPQARDPVNEVKDTSTCVDELAFLEPHKHAKTIFEFCMRTVGNPNVLATRGCRLVIFSRFDEDMNPEKNAIELRYDTGSLMPAQDYTFIMSLETNCWG